MTKEKKTIDYPKGLTFEQVWAGIQELGKKYDAIFEREAKERQERQEREERQAKEWQERLKVEEERRKAEAAAEAERRKAEAAAEAERRKEIDERMRKLQEHVDKTTLSVDRLSKNMGGLSNTFGEMVEHLVAPNIVEKFNELGYHFDDNYRSRFDISENGQVVTEVDLLLENGKTVVVVEVKARPTLHDIRKHLKRMPFVRRWYCARYGNSNKEFIGAVASGVFPKNIKQFAIENGFYVLTQTGDTVKIDVPEDFKPRIF